MAAAVLAASDAVEKEQRGLMVADVEGEQQDQTGDHNA